MSRQRGASAAAVLMIVIAMTTGCASSGQRAGGCVPRMTVEPSSASAGDRVTFSSHDVCDVDAPETGWRIEAHTSGEDASSVLVRSSEPFDGSWSTDLVVPSDFAVGEASISVANWDYSSCPDDASCAAPIAELTITQLGQ